MHDQSFLNHRPPQYLDTLFMGELMLRDFQPCSVRHFSKFLAHTKIEQKLGTCSPASEQNCETLLRKKSTNKPQLLGQAT